MDGIHPLREDRKYLELTWDDFDKAVEILIARIPDKIKGSSSGWFLVGEPRGGLALACAISNRARIPMEPPTLVRPVGILWIDDYIESGLTLRRARRLLVQTEFFGAVWVTKQAPDDDLISVVTIEKDVWPVFPWEVQADGERERTN